MDRSLVERAQHGDQAAFEALASASAQRLWSIARRVLNDHDAAEDAVQECLVRAWRDLRALRDPDRFEAWLYRLLVHACRDQQRASHRQQLTVLDAIAEPTHAGDLVVDTENRDQLRRGFDRLSVDHRAAVVLHHVIGLPTREIAETLGVPEGTVISRVHYAMRALRSGLDADLRPGPAVAAAAVGGEK